MPPIKTKSQRLKPKINFHFLSATRNFGRRKRSGKRTKNRNHGTWKHRFVGTKKTRSYRKFKEIACDSVVLAIGERVDSEVFAKEGLQVAKDGRIRVHPLRSKLRSTKYLPRRRRNGSRHCGRSNGNGKRAAESIDFILMNEKRFQLLSKEFEYKNAVPTDIKKALKRSKQTSRKRQNRQFS